MTRIRCFKLAAHVYSLSILLIACVGCIDTNEMRKRDCEEMQNIKARYLQSRNRGELLKLESIASGDDSFRRSYALMTIGELGTAGIEATNTLLASIDSTDPVTQRSAVQAIGEVTQGTDIAVPKLCSLLIYEECDFGWLAADSLGEIGPAAKSALPFLEKAVRSKNPTMTSCARRAINKITRN